MSYCRFSDADVYVFLAVDLGLECCGCILQEREWVDDPDRPIFGGYLKAVGEKINAYGLTTDEMLAHLQRHRAAGHDVPDYVFADLEADREENDAYLAALDTGEAVS